MSEYWPDLALPVRTNGENDRINDYTDGGFRGESFDRLSPSTVLRVVSLSNQMLSGVEAQDLPLTNMETKDQFKKILEWMKQMSRSMATLSMIQDLRDDLLQRIDLSEKKLHNRIDALDERFDSLSAAIQSTLKAVRGVRVEQFNDRSRFDRDIQKIKQEIRSLMH